MQPPPPLATSLTTLSCIGLVVWTFISQGRSTAALPVTAFTVLSLQLLTTKKPRFAQLTSSIFGLFYCGESHQFHDHRPTDCTEAMPCASSRGTCKLTLTPLSCLRLPSELLDQA